MATDQGITQQEFDRAVEWVRADRCSWEEAVRLARFSKAAPPAPEEEAARERDRRDDSYDEDPDDGQVARAKTKPLRLEDDETDDDRVPRPRQLKEPQVVRRRSGHDDGDDDDDDSGGRRAGNGRGRRQQTDALIAKVAEGRCVGCGREPAGSVWVKSASAEEDKDLDGKHEHPQSHSYLVPMCLSCKEGDEADEAGETAVHSRHSKGRGDVLRYNRAARLQAEARDRDR
jgi:hypothetical protein